jgi:hypothetical protein
MKTRGGTPRTSLTLFAPGALLVFAAGCGEDASGKHWNSLATCLAGPAAGADVLERVPKIRQAMLASSPPSSAKDAWPGRCAQHADALYAGLDKSGKGGGLKRKLRERFSCSDEAATCKIAADTTLIGATTELWESAKAAGFKTEVAADVPAPPSGAAPALDAKTWKPFSDKPLRVSGPVLTSDGRALVALKPAEGRARPIACEFTSDFAKVRCVNATDKIPESPAHAFEIVNDAKGLYVAGLTEKGLVAYNVETGETSDVRGRTGRLIRNGVAAERPVKDDISGGPPDPTAKPAAKPKGGKGMFEKPKGAVPDEGYVAVELRDGKASKEVKLGVESTLPPITVANQILWLSPTESGVELGVKSLKSGRLQAGAPLKGTFAGAFHTCQKGETYALATYAGRSGQGSAKPTGGPGKTALTFAVLENGAWSKPAEATLPFERAGDSELSCSDGGASVAWMKTDKGSAQIGRIDCKADGCQSKDVTVPGLESTYLWSVGTLGDKVFVLYRGALGETRLRVAPLADLPSAKDTIVFDSGDFGGPTTGELVTLLGESAALLIFRGENPPVALRLGSDGAVSVVASG